MLSKSTLVLLLALSCCLLPTTAYAYLDPGTGSYVFQMVIAVVLSGVVALRHYWKRLKVQAGKLFSGRPGNSDPTP